MVKPFFGLDLYALLFLSLLSIPFYQSITTTTPPFVFATTTADNEGDEE